MRSLTPNDPEYKEEYADDVRSPHIAWLTLNGDHTVPLVPTASGSALYTVLPGNWWTTATRLGIDVEDDTGFNLLGCSLDPLAFW